MAYSPARLVLDAAQLAAEADIQGLRNLVGSHGDTLSLELVLRILLTCMPESTEPSLYVSFLQDLESGNLSPLDESSNQLPVKTAISEKEIERRARKLHLLALSPPTSFSDDSVDALTCFLLNRAHQIDLQSGSILFVQQLLEPFVEHSGILGNWIACILLPLLRLEYEYYPLDSPNFTLGRFEELRGASGVSTLLSEIFKRNENTERKQYGRDLRGLLGPWVHGEVVRLQGADKKGKDAPSSDGAIPRPPWALVNEWLIEHAARDNRSVFSAFREWDGPHDIDFGGWIAPSRVDGHSDATWQYAKCLMAFVYLPKKHGNSPTLEQRRTILQRAAELEEIDLKITRKDTYIPSLVSNVQDDFVTSITTAHLLHGNLLEQKNPLTNPNSQSLELASLLLSSKVILDSLGETLPLEVISSLTLFGFEADQRTRMKKTLSGLLTSPVASDATWSEVREKLLWLRRWNTTSVDAQKSRQGLFCLVSIEEMEVQILKALVTAGRFKLVAETYINQAGNISREEVEKSILSVSLALYDNASNGNKTRGGVKKASDIITAFRMHFPESIGFQQTASLIQATHALSFYSLTLQHGVAFLPVNLRVQSNPLSLIDKLLTQNSKSYTKLDDLKDIGRNLYGAGLISSSHDEHHVPGQEINDEVVLVERQVIAKAIEAALVEGDFDTAYSYVVNRLSPLDSSEHAQSPGDSPRGPRDDILWKAAYQAGRYQPKSKSGPSQLRRIEQRMELLSQALLLAPPSSLPDVLATWRSCEQEMNASIAKEIQEEERWNNRGDRSIPGGFTGDDIVPTPHQPREATRKAMNEGAPMGLFDVARGAAAALSSSAFPLRGAASDRRPSVTSAQPSTDVEHPDSADHEGEGRVRKRDMVSSMVTGGLASGIGWVIGAPPARAE